MGEMLAVASDPKVKRLLKAHIKQTEGQIANLERVHDESIGNKPRSPRSARGVSPAWWRRPAR